MPGTSLLSANSHRSHGHLSKACVLGNERTVGPVQMCLRVRSRAGVSPCPCIGTWGKVRCGIPRSCTQGPTWERSEASRVVDEVNGCCGLSELCEFIHSFNKYSSSGCYEQALHGHWKCTHQAGAMNKHYTATGNAEAAFLSEISKAGRLVNLGRTDFNWQQLLPYRKESSVTGSQLQ